MPSEEFRIGRLKGQFVVTWWEDGKRRRYRLDALSRKEAESEAIAVVRREVIAGSDRTIATLWELYRTEKQGRRVAVAMKSEWAVIGPHFGHLTHNQIDTAVCRAYVRAQRKASRGDGTIWTELGHLRTVLEWARKGQLIPYAPAIERPSKPPPKDRWLNDAELEALLSANCAHHILVAMHLMLGTAARHEAAVELTWDRVDFARKQIDLRVRADGPRKGRAVVPMNDTLAAVLFDAKQKAMSDYVIEWAGKPVKRIKTGFYAAAAKAGLKDVSPHTLRHTAGVRMAAAGVPMQKISQYMGHTSTAVTERVYARFAPDHLRDAARALDLPVKLRVVR